MKSFTLSAVAAVVAAPWAAQSKAVFCHYLVGTVSTEHAQQDIQDAKAMGCDAFALDLLQPTQSYTGNTVQELFAAAQQQDFKLFFSLDVSADPTIGDFDSLLTQYLSNSAYYTGPNGAPFISTFNDGVLGLDGWSEFRQKYGNMYFVPDFDSVPDYYDDPSSFFAQYSNVVDGVFNWETAWPGSGLFSHQNVSTDSDLPVQQAASAAGKSFMIGLSSLQFKDIDGLGFYFRIGDINLPQRMEEILAMSPSPDYVEIITWNDAGESHYVGNIWDESGLQPYSTGDEWSHAGWQPLLSSFITAWKGDGTMTPSNGNAQGAMWYRTDLTIGTCNKPTGFEAAVDAVNFAVVADDGYSVRITSGDMVVSMELQAGLNYNAVPGIQAGAQKMELLDASGNTVMTAQGALPVNPGGSGSGRNCNFNFQVAGLQ